MVELKKVSTEQRELLYSINQKYLYEMTNFYDDEMDEDGNYHYGYFDEYFTDPKRHAYFIYADGRLCGFAMVHPYSNFGGEVDYVMGEFTVFPAFRRRHVATEAAEKLLDMFRGEWEIKFNEKNTVGKSLWCKVTEKYAPVQKYYGEVETVLCFSNSN